MGGERPRLLFVSPRPPRADGQGDQRRASVAVEALSTEWDIEVGSWLPDVGEPDSRLWELGLRFPLRVILLALRKPLTVAYMQARLPPALLGRIRRRDYDEVLFVTDRSVPAPAPDRFCIDFIDDLGGAALRRSANNRGLASAFWRIEGVRLRRYDRRLAARARVAIACNPVDAANIHPAVKVVHLAVATQPMREAGTSVAFIGNLFYSPNHDASMWICDELVPELAARGVEPSRIVVSGRRPLPALRDAAARAGIRLLPDVEDLAEVLRGAAVVIAPMALGSGTQNKVLDAVGAGRPCVITELVNQSLGLIDGRSALVCQRDPKLFADAVVELLEDPHKRRAMAAEARRELNRFMPESVHAAWRDALR